MTGGNCPKCAGTGVDPDTEATCSTCGGQGEVDPDQLTIG